jgi:dipeptidyl aminopeptidase/acylaminoacyl peptidase
VSWAAMRPLCDRMREHCILGSWYVRGINRARKRDDSAVVNRSHPRAAVNVTASVLLIHGVDDTVVPFEQSQMMDTALKAAGKQSRLTALKAEDHWLTRSETRTQVLIELEKFLAENLK